MGDRKYANQKPLRRAAKLALRARGFEVEVLKGSGGARLKVRKGSEILNVAVRTSSDRWIGWMRNEEGDWRAMGGTDLIVVAAFGSANMAEVFGLDPKKVEAAFSANLAARLSNNAVLADTAPVFVCLDPVASTRGVTSTGSDLKREALWKMEVPLDPSESSDGPDAFTRSNVEPSESFIDRVRREFAALNGVAIEKVSVEFKISA